MTRHLPNLQKRVHSYLYQLAPVVCPMLQTSNEKILVRAVVRCFPTIAEPDLALRLELVKRLGALTVNGDR